MNKDKSGSAFPRPTKLQVYDNTLLGDPGITIRDYFAAAAMQGLMTTYWNTPEMYENSKALIECQVETAYEYADAMLKEMSKA